MATVKTTPLNRSLHAAKSAKQDEFYTQYVDIQKEVEAYPEFDPNLFNEGTFKGKIIYCNCDDPFESNFFTYPGAPGLITTGYDGSPIAGQMTLFPEHTEGNGKCQRGTDKGRRCADRRNRRHREVHRMPTRKRPLRMGFGRREACRTPARTEAPTAGSLVQAIFDKP